MDVPTLITAITAGAAIAGAETVKEGTKDAYRALKGAMANVLGRRAERAIAQIEAAPTDATARSELTALAKTLPAEDAPEIEPKLDALLIAFAVDSAVKPVAAAVARINLDIDAGGHVTLEDLEAAREIDVKARSGGDFVLRGVKMDSGPARGN
jgi:hypothetical protein